MLSSHRSIHMDGADSRPSRLHLSHLLLALLLGLCLSLSGFSTAGATQPLRGPGLHSMAAADPPCDPAKCGTPPLIPHGGPIQSSPHLLLVFWGPKWNTDVDSVISETTNFFQNLTGGDYQNILRQYGVRNQVQLLSIAGKPYFIDGTTPELSLQKSDISSELSFITLSNNIDVNDPNLQVMVFPQSGTTYAWNACAEHINGPYFAIGIISYAHTNCFPGVNAADSMTNAASHEYAEMATDPQQGPHPAWTTSDGSEIADLCNDYHFFYTTANGYAGAFFAQELYSNADQGCVQAVGTAFLSPDKTFPFNGQHTVQGSILARYNAGGGANYHTVLGNPLTEEVPITGGAVTYFDASPCNGGYPIPSSVSSVYGGSGLTSGSAIYFSHATSAHAVRGCIYRYYQGSLGGPTNPDGLGYPLTDELPVTGGGGSGRVSYFGNQLCGSASNHLYGSGSAIYYSGSAYFVRGCIYDRYQSLCGDDTGLTCVDMLGMPVTSELSFPNGGAISYFAGTQCNGGDPLSSGVVAGSAIYYSSATGTHEVQSCIFQHYAFLFGPSSSILGYPTSDEHLIAGGYVSDFQGTPCSGGSWGHIFYSAATGAREVHGCIDDAYIHPFGGPSGFLGFPTSDEQAAGSGSRPGRVNNFAGQVCGSGHGQIYYNSTTHEVHEVHGCIDQKYLACGGAAGPLGFPISDEKAMAGNPSPGRESDFQNGYIFWENGQAIVVPVGVTVNC